MSNKIDNVDKNIINSAQLICFYHVEYKDTTLSLSSQFSLLWYNKKKVERMLSTFLDRSKRVIVLLISSYITYIKIPPIMIRARP